MFMRYYLLVDTFIPYTGFLAGRLDKNWGPINFDS